MMKDAVLACLPREYPWADRFHWFDSIDSTNDRLKAMAAQDAPHGTVLLADHQTGGRGRRGRSFHSPAGTGIYMSVLLRPDCAPTELMHLTCAAAVAMCDAVEASAGIRPGIKWTNDLVWGKRKLAGILTELGLDKAGRVSYAIIGVGLNCCQSDGDFPEEIRDIAASLAAVTGQKVHRAEVAAAMMDAFSRMSGKLLTEKEQILQRYSRDCITLGKQISLLRGDDVRHGKALAIDDRGALVVEFSDGYVVSVDSGEVSVRGMYGYL